MLPEFAQFTIMDIGLMLGALMQAREQYEQAATRHADFQPAFAEVMKARASQLKEVTDRLEIKLLSSLPPAGFA